MRMEYQYSKRTNLPFELAVEQTISALRQEGFGIIHSIDLRQVYKEKLNVVFRNYVILGACNPQLSYEAILEEDKLGVFLPCNVIVQEHENGQTEISVVNPEALMQDMEDLNLKSFATEVKSSLLHALEQL